MVGALCVYVWYTGADVRVGFTAFVPRFKADVFVTSYIGVVVYLANIVWWKCFKGTKRVQANAMDLGKE